MAIQGFNISEVGSWPRERYHISPVTTYVNPILGALPFNNEARFVNNPIFNIENFGKSYFSYVDANIGTNIVLDTFTIDFLSSSSYIVFTASAARVDRYDNYVQYFDIDVDTSGAVLYTGFLFYPKRLFLKPTGVTKNSSSDFTLNARTSLIDAAAMYFQTDAPKNNAVSAFYNRLYRSGKYITPSDVVQPLTFTDYPTLPENEVLFHYNLSATETLIKKPIYSFGNNPTTNNPSFFSIALETNYPRRIRPDSTFIEFEVNFQAFRGIDAASVGFIPGTPYNETLYNIYYDDPLLATAEFNTSISHIYRPTISPTTLTFLLVQSAINVALVAQHPTNSVLSAVMDLESTNFRYFAKTVFNTTLNSFVNIVSGVEGSTLNLNYIIDYGNIKSTTEHVADTLIPANVFTVAGTPAPISTFVRGVSSSIGNSNQVSFRTKYPPHYYSYNVSINNPLTGWGRILNSTEQCNLTFHLSSFQYANSLSSTFVKTFLYSDLEVLKLDLPTYAYNHNDGITTRRDKILYQQEKNASSLLNDLSAYIIKGGIYANRTYYDLNNPTWVDAFESDTLEITFPKTFAGTPTFTIRPKMSTLVGFKDALYNTNVRLTGLYIQPTYPLTIDIIREADDFIDVSAAALTSVFVYPGVDLNNTNISWIISPNNNPDIKINNLKVNNFGTYNPISALNANITYPFNSNTWAIRVSGYGPTTVSVTLSSQSRNSTGTVSSDPTLFNYFVNNTILLEPIQAFNNFEETRTISLCACIPYKNRKYNLPNNQNVYWNWSYNGSFDNTTAPITAKYFASNIIGSDYFSSDTDAAESLSALYFYIKPPLNANPETRNVNLNIFATDTVVPISGTYPLVIDDYPARNIFNADFTVAYQAHPNTTLLNTRNQTYVLTRPDNGSSFYTASANTDIIPIINARGYLWTVIKDGGAPTYYNNLTAIYFNTNGSYKTDITFTALSAAPAGWPFLHNVSQSITIYTLNDTEFNRPTIFNIYPEYSWPNRYILKLDNLNYNTSSVAPTAYAYKASQTETFNVSANKDYTKYKYAYGFADINFAELNSPTGQITLPYTTQLLSETGMFVTLTGYNIWYPENTPIRYLSLEAGNLVTRTYNITARTIPYNKGTSSTFAFRQNPKLVDYNTIIPTFTATITALDLDYNRIVKINQTINTIPASTPAYPNVPNSTLTYILSSPKWVITRDIPPVDGIFDVFTLGVGDSLNPSTVDGTTLTNLRLNVSANLNIKIPSSTFDNYAFFEYPGIRDLWTTTNTQVTANNSRWQTLVAYSTSAGPEIFLNTNYTITATPVFVQFKTPFFENNPIVSYQINFGENIIKTGAYNETFTYQYSSIGTFFVIYSAIYLDGSYKVNFSNVPISVAEEWETYNQENIRTLNESTLQLPYTLEEILIQPNEFGDKDIFNTSITRLDECLQYLRNNMQTMNVDAPTYFYGWLGNNFENRSDGIRWYTESYGEDFYEVISRASSEGFEFFTNIKDIEFTENYIFVLDNKVFRVFKTDKNATEIKFDNFSEIENFFIDPKSITVSDDETSLFVADSIRHKVFRYDLDFSDPLNPIFALVLSLGTFGSLNDAGKFDFPTDLHYYNDNLYVLDYNNNCVKQYTKDMSWIFTYYDDIFAGDQIQAITINPTGLLYVITKSYKLCIFDNLGENAIQVIQLTQFNTLDEIVKMTFDLDGEFLYVSTKNIVLKYSAVGLYITTFNLPQGRSRQGGDFTSIKPSKYKCINISTGNCILRTQDFVNIFRIGDGLGSNYWSLDQMLLKKEQFAQDINYNSSLIKIAQNLKTLRNTLNAKFVLVTEQSTKGAITYFSILPIDKDNRPVFDTGIENEFLFVGANEFHIPTVLNRELTKIYNSLETMKTKLNVTNTTSTSNEEDLSCGNSFCWSWKAMSCYNLTLPLIRLCNVNPITYAELVRSFPINYAPSKLWKDATSVCCANNVSPIE